MRLQAGIQSCDAKRLGVQIFLDCTIEPSPPFVSSMGSYNITLRWKASNISEITYMVQYKYVSIKGEWKYTQVVTETSYTVTNLQPYTEYWFRVIWIICHLQYYSASSLAYRTLADGVPSDAPQIESIVSFSSDTVEVSWLPPLFPNGRILGYILKLYTNIEVHGPVSVVGRHSFQFYGTKPATTYRFTITTRNEEGEGPTAQANVTTPNSGFWTSISLRTKVYNIDIYNLICLDPDKGLWLFLSKNKTLKKRDNLKEVAHEAQCLEAQSQINGIAVNVHSQLVYYSEGNHIWIKGAANMSDMSNFKTFHTGYGSITSLSVDWLYSKLFFTMTNQIYMCDLTNCTTSTKIPLKDGLKPKKIEVDPYNGYLFLLVDDGIHRMILPESPVYSNVTEHIVKSADILDFTVIVQSKRLIYIKGQSNFSLESVFLDGTNNQLLRELNHQYIKKITSFIYFNDLLLLTTGNEVLYEEFFGNLYWYNEYVVSCSLKSASLEGFNNMILYGESAQPVPLPGHPEHVMVVFGIQSAEILWSPPRLTVGASAAAWQKWTYTVSVSSEKYGIQQFFNNITSSGITAAGLNISTKYEITVQASSSAGVSQWTNPVVGTTFDSEEEETYFLAVGTTGVWRQPLDKFGPGELLSDKLRYVSDLDWYNSTLCWSNETGYVHMWNVSNTADFSPLYIPGIRRAHSLAFDWIGHYIYWADKLNAKIHRTSLKTFSSETVNVGRNFVNDLAVDPVNAFLYWSTDYTVEISRLNGQDHLILQNLTLFSSSQVVALTLDLKDELLYWVVKNGLHINLYRTPIQKDRSKHAEITEFSSWSTCEISEHALVFYSDRIYWINGQKYITVQEVQQGSCTPFSQPAEFIAFTLASNNLKRLPVNFSHSPEVIPGPISSSSFEIQGNHSHFTIIWKGPSNIEYGTLFYCVDSFILHQEKKYISFPDSMASWNVMKLGSYNLANMPNVMGTIDCTHVVLLPPVPAVRTSCYKELRANNAVPARTGEMRVGKSNESCHNSGKFTDSFYTVEGLEPYTEFDFAVSPYTYWGKGNTTTVTLRSPQGVPTAPLNLRVYITQNSTWFDMENIGVELRWDKPSRSNGILTNYLVSYRLLNESQYNSTVGTWLIINTTASLDTYILYNVSSEILLQFQVKAYTSAGPGPFSEIAEVSISDIHPVPALISISGDHMSFSDEDRKNILWNLTAEGNIRMASYLAHDGNIYYLVDDMILWRDTKKQSTVLLLKDGRLSGSKGMTADWIARRIYVVTNSRQNGTQLLFIDLESKNLNLEPVDTLNEEFASMTIDAIAAYPLLSRLYWIEYYNTGSVVSYFDIQNSTIVNALGQYSTKVSVNDCNCHLKTWEVITLMALDIANTSGSLIFLLCNETSIWASDMDGCNCWKVVDIKHLAECLTITSLTADAHFIYWSVKDNRNTSFFETNKVDKETVLLKTIPDQEVQVIPYSTSLQPFPGTVVPLPMEQEFQDQIALITGLQPFSNYELEVRVKNYYSFLQGEKPIGSFVTGKTDYGAKFDTLQEQFNYFRHDLDKIRDRAGEAERRIGEAEDRLSTHTGEIATLRRQVTTLMGRAEDAEDRNRRNNVRILGLPEKAEGASPEQFVENLIKETLAPVNLTTFFTVERAHRIPMRPLPPGTPPRPFIFKVLHYRDRDAILAAARMKGAVTFNNARLSFFPDFTSEVQKLRRSFNGATIFDKGDKNGKTLAYLARAENKSNSIAGIVGAGETVTEGGKIAQQFLEYYSALYSSRVNYGMEELESYLDQIKFPELAPEDREALDSPITIDEVRNAMRALPGRKAPGPDGLPAEWYKQGMDRIAPRLWEVLKQALDSGGLPASFHEAHVALIHKEGKPADICASYRPISLLNQDAKILAKILANRLNGVILQLIGPDQSGFMPGRTTGINLRRLMSNLQIAHDNCGSRAIASLDNEKAFDSIEWVYLWAVLAKFGLPAGFISYIKLLYDRPTARVRVNGCYSDPFVLQRGTRQGCPLSPLLFALAIEPLAIIIRNSPAIAGWRLGEIEEKISLYADDTLLYLADSYQSLEAALDTIGVFGRFSGLKVNWDKSSLMQVDGSDPRDVSPRSQLKRVQQFKYLGIMVSGRTDEFVSLNISPPKDNPVVCLEVALLGFPERLASLVYRSTRGIREATTCMRAASNIWERATRLGMRTGEAPTWSPYAPLWDDPRLPETSAMQDPLFWARKRVQQIGQLYRGGVLVSFDQLRAEFQLSNRDFFRYLQLRHALHAQFRGEGPRISESRAENLLRDGNLKKPVSALYRCLMGELESPRGKIEAKWQDLDPSLDQDDWEEIMENLHTSVVEARDRFIQTKWIHQAYITLVRLHRMGLTDTDVCPRCGKNSGSWLHMIWSCEVLMAFWEGVMVPEAAPITSITVLSDSVVNISWTEPSKPNGPLNLIRYQIKTDNLLLSPSVPLMKKEFPDEKLQWSFKNLKSETLYQFKVLAFHPDENWYTESSSVPVKTFKSPAPPHIITARNTSVVLEWIAPGEPIADFWFEEYQLNYGSWYRPNEISCIKKSVYNCTISGHVPNTNYGIRTVVIFIMGAQGFSDLANFRTAAGVPNKPGVPQNVPGDKNTIQWKMAEDNGSNLTYNILEYREAVSDGRSVLWHLAYNDSCGDICLWKSKTLDGTFQFRAAAANMIGLGNYSDTSENILLSKEKGSSNEVAVAVGSVLGILLILLMVTGFVFYKKSKQKPIDKLNIHVFHEDKELANLRGFSYAVGLGNACYAVRTLPTKSEMEDLPSFPRENLTLSVFLGSGAFGEVYEGTAKDILGPGTGISKVAVKTLKSDATNNEKFDFLKEAHLMSQFHHGNILKLLGVCLFNEPQYIILELMNGGDLLTYLRGARPLSPHGDPLLSPLDLLDIAVDISTGCAYLEKMHFVHRDLAARNCLVSVKEYNSPDRTVKIGDFGLARDVYKTDYYRKKGEGLLPVRWMSPESLIDGIFTTHSDVWSFGVLLWELFTLGQQPYQGFSNMEVVHYIRSGQRMDSPDNCPDNMLDLMLECWTQEPFKRPSFAHIHAQLEELKSCSLRCSCPKKRRVDLQGVNNLGFEDSEENILGSASEETGSVTLTETRNADGLNYLMVAT
ncbi:proto-oncogene tyrosine-protein kinase ROS [Gastrophryne carolinensis]